MGRLPIIMATVIIRTTVVLIPVITVLIRDIPAADTVAMVRIITAICGRVVQEGCGPEVAVSLLAAPAGCHFKLIKHI